MASKPEQEPSIEEILASIRQIISDDDQPREADVDLSAGPEEKFEIPVAQPEPAKEEPKSSFAEVLELTNEIPEEPAFPPVPDIGYDEGPKFTIPVEEPVAAAPPPPAAPAPKPDVVTPFPAQSHASLDAVESIFTSTAAEATAQAFSKLMGNIPVEREENSALYAGGRVTLEDIVKDMLKPMLRDWVDAHVPGIVERLVEKELEKLTKQFK